MTSDKFDFELSRFVISFVMGHLGISAFCVYPLIGFLRNQRKRFFYRKTSRLLHCLILFRPELVDVCEHRIVQNLQSFAKLPLSV